MKKKVKKIHFFNNVYAKKNRYKKPKEIFSFLINILKKRVKKNLSLIDVGCANGELLYNLNRNFKNLQYTGIDIDHSLLKKAKKNCPKNIVFKKKDISKKLLGLGKFDIVILSGVLSIFDNGEKILKNILQLTKPKGSIYIFDSLNIYSYNLHINSNTKLDNKKIYYYKNIYSTKYISDFFKKNKRKCKFFQFRLKTNIKKDLKNLNNVWTEYLSGNKIVTSGLGIIQNQFWVKIEK